MAIKIIKEGKKEYHMTCFQCGCEFTYELEDISGFGFVNCPTCNSSIAHRHGISGTIGWPGDVMAIQCDNFLNKETNPCETCDWYKKMKGATYIGDTPCTWCKYGSFTVSGITATSTSVTKLD